MSMLRRIPPHCEAGGHPGSLYASNTVTKFKRPYSNTTTGPYKARGELFCLYPIHSKEALLRYLVTAVRMVIIRNLYAINVGVDVEKMEPSYTICENEN